MIYLCSVYSLNKEGLSKELQRKRMDKRYDYAMKRTAGFIKDGVVVFSPISHCHEFAKRYGLPKTFEFWEQLDYGYIEASSHIWVLMMPGWEDSTGVTAEIKEARRKGKPVTYIECEDYEE